MAKGNKSSRNHSNNSGDSLDTAADVQAGEPQDVEEAGQPALAAQAHVDDEPATDEDSTEATPFVFDTVPAPEVQAPHEEGQGQFGGDEMEFESWMFDAGDGRGIVMPEHAAQAQEAGGSPITGHDIPMPDFAGAFTQSTDIPRPPLDDTWGSVQDFGLDPDDLVSGMGASASSTNSRPVYEHLPSSPAGWNDQMLASVDDFSSVLLAMGQPPAQADLYMPPVAPVTQDAPPPAPVEASSADQEPAPSMESAPQAEPVWDAEPAEALHPAWLQEDLQESLSVPAPEMQHDPETFVSDAGYPSEDLQAGQGVYPYAPVDAEVAQEDAPAPEQDLAAEPQADFPDFSWAEQASPSAEQPELAPQAYDALDNTEQAAPEQVAEAEPVWSVTQEEAPQQETAAEQDSAPAWSPVLEENLPPWLVEAAEGGILTEPQEAGQGHPDADAKFAVPEQVEPQTETPDFSAWQDDVAAGVAPAAFQPPADAPTEAPAEGQFSGAEMEFESWMFDKGAAAPLPSLPGMADMVPTVQGMESAVAWQMPGGETPAIMEAQMQAESRQLAAQEASTLQMVDAEPVEEELPFWLQDRPALQHISGGLTAPVAEDFPSVTEQPAMGYASVAVQEPEPETEQVSTFDFADLPPIEPFDFSALQPEPEEEELGFSTEELASTQTREHEPMMVTANLDVLADLLGKDRVAGMRNAEDAALNNLLTQQPPQTPAQPAGQPEAPQAHVQEAQVETPQAEVSAPRPVGAPPTAQPDTDQSTGWTATPTSQLTSEGLENLATGSIRPAPPSTRDADVAGSAESDLNVSPFDVAEMDLDEEEASTGFLTGSISQASFSESPEKILTGTLFSIGGTQGSDFWEAPAWMADVVESEASSADRNTSRMAPAQAEPETDDSEPTQYLSGRAGRDAAPAQPVAEAEPEPEFSNPFKARVSRFNVAESSRSEYQQDEPAAQPAPMAASAPAEAKPAPSSPLSAPLMTSGPLNKPRGFEGLEAMVAARPNEVGPHMALAVAYSQAGYTEHALYEYSRILNNRQVPAPMMQMISDRLEEMKDDADGLARYHQLRGDLFMKQGLFEEAIEEYNRIK